MSVLILLAPSKTMDFESELPFEIDAGSPLFMLQAVELVAQLKELDADSVAKLMSVSNDIAEQVVHKYHAFKSANTGKPAIYAYAGDVYKGIQATSLSKQEVVWAQQHLLIVSGLYGLLRPFDGVQGYRLEMKTKLVAQGSHNLYQFWGSKLADYITEQQPDWVCNLCSDEYAKAVFAKLPKRFSVVTPLFLDTKPSGIIGSVPIYSKMMRGVMAGWMIRHQADSPDALQAFSGHGYRYSSKYSKPNAPAFYRKTMKPLVFA